MFHVDVGDALVHEHQATFGEAQPHVEPHKVDGVFGVHKQLVAALRHLRFDRSPAHEHGSGAAVRLKPGAPGEGLGTLRQQRRPQRRVRLFGERRDLERHRVERGESVFGAWHTEIAAPVFHLRHLVFRRLQHNGHTVAPQCHMIPVIEHRCLLAWRVHRFSVVRAPRGCAARVKD